MVNERCSFDGCTGLVQAKSLCYGHYQQQRLGKPLVPLRSTKTEAAKCSFVGCDKKAKANKLCSGHWAQRDRGKPLADIDPAKTAEERFEEKVDRSGECHRWTGFRSSAGYGRFYFEGKVDEAHRVALILLDGVDIPSFMTVDHVWARGCRYRDCVNTEHLDVVTQAENNLRKAKNGANY